MANWDKYTFRCHRLGELMPKPKGDNLVSDTTAAYLYQVYDEVVNGVKEILDTKELRKGIQCEQDSIDLVNQVHGTFFVKNEQHRENEWVRGTADIVVPRVVVDIKSSWSLHTFRKGELTRNNYWQMLGYLWLWKKKHGFVAYALVDTPFEFIADAQRQLAWKMNMIDDTDPEYTKAAEQIERNMTFGHIPAEKRVKCFGVDYFEDQIDLVKDAITRARAFLNAIPKEEEDFGRIKLNGKHETAPTEARVIPIDEKINLIRQSVAKAHDIGEAALDGRSRMLAVVLAKHQYRALVSCEFKSLSAAGKKINVATSVISNSIKEHNNLLSYDTNYKEKYDEARQLLRRKAGETDS